MKRVVLVLALALAGCTDVFMLPVAPPSDMAHGHPPVADLFFIPGPVLGDAGGIVINDGAGVLPASCKLLPCSPGADEGNVDVVVGSLTGCHAYDKLTVSGAVRFDTFTACAVSIEIRGTGVLAGDGGGAPERQGPGAGTICGSGGGHGGTGADPARCGAGMTYDDPIHPRQTGSGGGGFGAGNGGGQVELAAGTIVVDGQIRANGMDGFGATAGGGSGGSILLEADTISGGGSVEARGGRGVGISGGGGGGGRVSILKTMGTPLRVDVTGGPSSEGDPGGTGTVQQP